MAFAHVTAVIESGLPMLEKLVALAIAESASRETDQAWLSWDTIAQRASSSRRGAQTAFERLERAGYCKKVAQKRVPRGYVWVFQIYIAALPEHVPHPTDAANASLEREDAESRATAHSQKPQLATDAAAASLPKSGPEGSSPPATGAPTAPVRDARERTTDAPRARVGMQGTASRDAPGASKSVPMNQVSEPVNGRNGPGSGPARPAMTREEAELRILESSARNLGIDGKRYGETLAEFTARIANVEFAQRERARTERLAAEGDVSRGTDRAKAAPAAEVAA